MPLVGGSSQLRNSSLQSSCQWKMESHSEGTGNRRNGGENRTKRGGSTITSRDGVRKAPGKQWGRVCRNLQHSPGPQTPDLCTLGSSKQDISLEGIPELLLSTKL